MKYNDKVKLIKYRNNYNEDGIHVNDVGVIILPEIRDNEFYICFETNDPKKHIKYASVKIEDLELVEDACCPDEDILEGIPLNNPKWWCKVEDGYIINLLGEKKNKIPYDYNS